MLSQQSILPCSNQTLHRHLDADEAVVLGAAKLAANLSTTFRPKNFGMADGAMYPIQLQVLHSA